MRFEILVQFIVPLTFLAIWALTSLLNRDAQPLPPRPGRPPGPGGSSAAEPGPRPGRRRAFRAGEPQPRRPAQPPRAERALGPSRLVGLAAAPASARPAPVDRRTGRCDRLHRGRARAARAADHAASGSAAGREPAPSPSARGPTRAGQQRRAGRSRTAPGGPASRARSEPETHRALSDQVNQSLAKQRSQAAGAHTAQLAARRSFRAPFPVAGGLKVGNWQSNMVQRHADRRRDPQDAVLAQQAPRDRAPVRDPPTPGDSPPPPSIPEPLACRGRLLADRATARVRSSRFRGSGLRR